MRNSFIKRSIRRAGVAACALVLFASAAVCQSAAQTKPVGKITLGWVKSTANLMAFIAPRISEKYGLTIETAYFNNAVDISTAMIAGQVDIGLLTPIHLIRAIDTGVDFVQIAGNTRGNTEIVAVKKLDLKENDWAALKRLLSQKKLKVVSSRGSINEMLAIAEFAKNGIDVDKDLDLVNIANFGQHPQALRSGDFDMVVTLEPLSSLSIVEGTATLFSRPYDTVAGDLNTNYVVRRDWLEKNADKAQAFVNTLKEAAQTLGTNKQAEESAATELTGLKPDVLKRALGNNHYELRNGLAQMQELARLSFERRYASKNVATELSKHVDDHFLNATGIK